MTTFRCSNELCQEEKDKQAEKRIKLIKDKELSEQLRAEKKLQMKEAMQKEAMKKAH
jgi:hypothetical protein